MENADNGGENVEKRLEYRKSRDRFSCWRARPEGFSRSTSIRRRNENKRNPWPGKRRRRLATYTAATFAWGWCIDRGTRAPEAARTSPTGRSCSGSGAARPRSIRATSARWRRASTAPRQQQSAWVSFKHTLQLPTWTSSFSFPLMNRKKKTVVFQKINIF